MSHYGSSTFITAEWRNIAMCSFEVAPDILHPLVPPGLQLDLWRGKAYVTVVGLCFFIKKILSIPFPAIPSFEQINLRFYVRSAQVDNTHAGVVFIKEIVPKPLVAITARLLFNQNYVSRPMSHKEGAVTEYSWQEGKQWQRMSVRGAEDFETPAKHSLEEFIVERYYGFVCKEDNVKGFQVAHPPWNIRMATEAFLECNVAEIYGPQFEQYMQTEPASAFLAEGGTAGISFPYRIKPRAPGI